MPSKKGILSIERDGSDHVFDPVAVDLDVAVMQESLQPFPVILDEVGNDTHVLMDLRITRCKLSMALAV